jgi:hypothetical protein
MTTKPTFTRSDFIRQRRASRSGGSSRTSKPAPATRAVYRPDSLYLPGRPRRDPQPVRGTRQGRGSGRARQYDIAFSLGGASVRAPAISLPQVDFSSSRWVSGLLALVLAAALFLMWNSTAFTVAGAEVVGNQRIGVNEINAVLGVIGEPVFKAVPAQIEANLRTAYPDLADAQVKVKFPNHIVVEVVERTPVLAWYQNNAMTWIDANGVAFMPRGDAPGLVQVISNGSPLEVQNDPDVPLYEQRFIQPEMVQVIAAVAPYVPAGMPMIFDPKYGIGWQDPRGWVVYFGQNTQDMPAKLTVYAALVDQLISRGIHPTLISMEYLDAPIYK